jgi:hypothetical protein
MAVEIIEHRQDGGATVVHTEMNHGGTVLGVNVQFATNPDGSINADYLLMPCPVCDAASVHPIGGGRSPGQSKFFDFQMRAQVGDTARSGLEHIKMLVCERVCVGRTGQTCSSAMSRRRRHPNRGRRRR